MSTRFSTADAAWLHMDRPSNLMVINSVMTFDEPVDWDRVREITQRRLVDVYPRFHQRPVESRLPFRPPKWEDDPDYALEHHIHHVALPAPGDVAALQELVGDLMTMPLDRNRPLWHMYLIEGFGEGAAIISRMHHCIADGIALARVMLSLTDTEAEAGIASAEERDAVSGRPDSLVESVRGVIGGAGRLGAAAVRQGTHVATSPAHAAALAGAVARDGATVLRLLLTPADAATAFKGEPGISRRVAWTDPIPLSQVKRIAHAHHATVNDVLLAAVAGAMRHYLKEERDGRVGEIQAMVPFNLRPLDQPVPRALGNKFGLVMLPLPVGMSGSYRRLVEVHRRMQQIKTGRDGPVSYGLLSLTGMTPEPLERRIIDLFTAKTTAVMTNVPGPREPVYLAGTPVRGVLVWAPTSGHMGMSVSIFSYRGEVTVGLMVDAALVPDPDHIAARLEHELSLLRPLKKAPRRAGANRSRRTVGRKERSDAQDHPRGG